ncbi:type II secretion system F family protein [Desulfococcaceae bacterium HSG8]|nr:type II secretion system F family protein [Desulfococcaceae bacterium HSG8]
MNYRYKALNPDGGLVTGSIASDNPRSAARLLRRQGLNVVDVKSEAETVTPGSSRVRQPGPRDVLMFMHQLCTLLESGISLEETAGSLAESAGHPFLTKAFSEMAAALRRGASFSEALNTSELNLPAYFYPLAEAGEHTGKMARAMRDGVMQWEYDIRTAAELRNALTYPVILIVSGILAVFLIFALVVPRFVKLLDRAQGEVPLLARFVLGMGSFVNEHLLLLGISAAALSVFMFYVFYNPDMRRHLRDFLARLPVLRHRMLESDIGRWAAMLATLLENRVGLLKSLELAQRYVTLTGLRSRLSNVSQSVRNGKSLAESLQDMGAITATGYNLIRVGERSGELPRMLRSLAALYTEMGRERIRRFLILLEPAAILIIGAVVGVIMAGIILAITSVNNISL